MTDDDLPDPRRWLAFGVVLVAGFVDLVDSTIVDVAVPSIQRDLHADYAQIEWVIAAYVLSFAALLLAILRVSFPPGERAKAVGMFGAVTGSSAVVGLALGGVIVHWDLFGWQCTLDLLIGQVPDHQAGNASGLLDTVQQIGLALGVALAGVVFFTQLAQGHDRVTEAASPGLRAELSALSSQRRTRTRTRTRPSRTSAPAYRIDPRPSTRPSSRQAAARPERTSARPKRSPKRSPGPARTTSPTHSAACCSSAAESWPS